MTALRPSRALAAALLGLVTGLVPAAGSALAAPAPADTAKICNKHCDARDPSLAPSERTPVSTEIYGRKVVLHLSDNDAMGWASIGSGDPGDEVWLDRSFDGGRTWDGGSKLGDTRTPDGSRGWRTLMYNVDDWNHTGVGALRACGKAGNRKEIACTPWARSDWNAKTPATQAATALMMLYDRDTGLFEKTGWWTSANALTALIDNARTSRMGSYEYAVKQVYDKNLHAQGGNFTNDYLDDTGWWGLAWVDAYDLTGDQRYLDTARADADHMADHWTPQCGGGVEWRIEKDGGKPYKNAVTNELYLQLTAALHNRIKGDTTYLDRAEKEWAWFSSSGMINSDHLINDGLDKDTCTNNNEQTWTYNQGVVLGGLTELHRATGDAKLLDTAKTLAGASTTAPGLHSDGILRDPGEKDSCSEDGASFKGAYVRGLGALNRKLSDHPYTGYLKRQADAASSRDRNALGMYGRHWNGPQRDTGHGCQHSALDLLNAAQ